MKLQSKLALSALAVCLSGCGPLVQFGSDEAPAPLFSLRASSREAQKLALPSPLLVSEPEPIAELRPPRIAVFTSTTGVSYLPQSRWVDPPARLVARLLEERIRDSSSGLVLGPRQFEVSYDHRLISRLTDFNIVVREGRHIARVGLEASLLSSPQSLKPAVQVVQTTKLTAERDLSSLDPKYVTESLNDAANDVATQLVMWLSTQSASKAAVSAAHVGSKK